MAGVIKLGVLKLGVFKLGVFKLGVQSRSNYLPESHWMASPLRAELQSGFNCLTPDNFTLSNTRQFYLSKGLCWLSIGLNHALLYYFTLSNAR
jgi:hypothetical protein